MNAFHPQTIEALRRDLHIWREQLDGAETDLRFREGQAAKAREAAETARQRVADYERLLAAVEAPAVAKDAIPAHWLHAEAADGETDADDEFLPDPLVFDAAEYYASIDAGEAFRLAERQKDAEMMWRHDEPAKYAAESDAEQQATQDNDTEERAL